MIEAGQIDQRARHPPSPSSTSSALANPQSPSSNAPAQDNPHRVEKSESVFDWRERTITLPRLAPVVV